MKKFVEKMIVERDDLIGKIKRGKAAVANPPFGMDKEGLMMLGEQVKAMEQYLYWLKERLKSVGVKE